MPYKTTIEEFEEENNVSILLSRTDTPSKETITGETVEARWLPSHFELGVTDPVTNADPDGFWHVLRWTSLEHAIRFTVRCKAPGDLTISGQATFANGSTKSTKVVYCRTADSSFGS